MKTTKSRSNYPLALLAFLALFWVAGSVHADVQIDHVDPDPACLGQQLKIFGGFGSAPSRYAVQIRPASGGNPLASYGVQKVTWSAARLTLDLPANAVAPGRYRLTVDTFGENGFAILKGFDVSDCMPAGGGGSTTPPADEGDSGGKDSGGGGSTGGGLPTPVGGINYQGPGSDLGDKLAENPMLRPDLEITFAKVDAPSQVEAGETVPVRVQVRNNGSKIAEFELAIGDPTSDDVLVKTGRMSVRAGRTNGATLHLPIPEWTRSNLHSVLRGHTFRTQAYIRDPNLRPNPGSPSRLAQIRTSGPWNDSDDSNNTKPITIRVTEPVQAAPTPAAPAIDDSPRTGKVIFRELHVAQSEEGPGDEPYIVIFRFRARLDGEAQVRVNASSGPGTIPQKTCSGGVHLGTDWAKSGDCFPLPTSPYAQTFQDVKPFEVFGAIAAVFEKDGTTTKRRGDMIQQAAKNLSSKLSDEFATTAPDGTRRETVILGDYSVSNCREVTTATLNTLKRFVHSAYSSVSSAYDDEIRHFGNPDEFLGTVTGSFIFVPCLGPAGPPDIAKDVGLDDTGYYFDRQFFGTGDFTLEIQDTNEATIGVPHFYSYEVAGTVKLEP